MSELLSLTQTEDGRFRYNRVRHPYLAEITKGLEEDHHNMGQCCVTTSGMTAIDLAFNSIFIENRWCPINIIHGSELYCDTPRLIRYYKRIYGNVNFVDVPVQSNQLVLEQFQKRRNGVNIFFIESCSNPSGFLVDPELLKEIKTLGRKVYIIVDNTWLTSTLFNPFKFPEVDIVVTSLTKHYSAGTCIAGAALFRNDGLYDLASNHIRIVGAHVSPHHCQIISEALPLMWERRRKSSRITKEVIDYLNQHSKVLEVSHPFMKDHPSHHLVKNYFTRKDDDELVGPDLFIFKVHLNKRETMKRLEKMTILKLKTSYGGPDSRIDPWPIEIGGETWCRMSIGYDDNVEQVKAGLKEFLDSIS